MHKQNLTSKVVYRLYERFKRTHKDELARKTFGKRFVDLSWRIVSRSKLTPLGFVWIRLMERRSYCPADICSRISG